MGGAMRHFYWVVFVFVSFFSFLGFHLDSVKATQMASVSQLREVTTTLAEYGYPDITVSDSVATFLPFSGSVSETGSGIPSSNGSADQNSWISHATDTISASGSAYGDAAWNGFTGGASVLSYSGFTYTYDVLSPSSYLFMGSGSSLRNVSDAMEAMVYADVLGRLRDLTNSTYLHTFSVGQDTSASFNYSGTLQPSRYSVYMSAQADVYPEYNEQFVDATASFQMQLKLAPSGTTIPVPEPKSVLLLLIGFAFLTRSARR